MEEDLDLELAEKAIVPTRIGLILANDRLDTSAIKFFLLSMNKAQPHLEYEILPRPEKSELMQMLQRSDPVDRNNAIRPLLIPFRDAFAKAIAVDEVAMQLQPQFPDRLVIVSLAKFSDNYYNMREAGISVLALGNWQRWMAPPSLVEFIQTLIVREAIAHICPALAGSIHLGTRGCICDFTADLAEARLKVMSGFICNSCQSALKSCDVPDVVDSIQSILAKSWVGSLANSTSTSSILKKLKLDLFHTSGLEPTAWEKTLSILREDGVKELIKIAGVVAGAAIIFYLGFKAGGH